MKILITLLFGFSFTAEASLIAYSEKLNRSLPENLDSITQLRKTSVQNNYLYYHFIVQATQVEYSNVIEKVKAQNLKAVCKQSRELIVFKTYKASLVYRYENEKGQSLGEFMIQPGHCP